jgi:hypothetical protein
VPGDYEETARGLIKRVLNNVDDKYSSDLEEKTGK